MLLGALVTGAFLLALVNEFGSRKFTRKRCIGAHALRASHRGAGGTMQQAMPHLDFGNRQSVTDGTVREFELFAKRFDLQGATLVVNSDGGSVLAAQAIGRIIRSLGMTTSVGTTTLLPSVAGDAQRATLSPYADCRSMCPLCCSGNTPIRTC
jgi:hypothetical protein